METMKGRPVRYTTDMIERAVSDLCRETDRWPSIRAVKARLGGGADKRIKEVLVRQMAETDDGRDSLAGPNPMAAPEANPTAEPAAILVMLNSDALTALVLTVLGTCFAGLAEVAQSHVDGRIAASPRANEAALEREVAAAVEAAMAEERRQRAILEARLFETESDQRRVRAALASAAQDVAGMVGALGKVAETLSQITPSCPADTSPARSSGGRYAQIRARGAKPSNRPAAEIERPSEVVSAARAGIGETENGSVVGEAPDRDHLGRVDTARAGTAGSPSGEGDRPGGRNGPPRAPEMTLPVSASGASGGRASAYTCPPGSSCDGPIGRGGPAGSAVVSGPWVGSGSGRTDPSSPAPGGG